MSTEEDGSRLTQAYLAHRPYLVDLAFRMLGDVGAAEDVVQDAFSRLMRADLGEIEDERGWLVVTSRLVLDQIKSARARRAHPGCPRHRRSAQAGVPAHPAGRST